MPVVLLVAANTGAYAGVNSPLGSGQLDSTPGSVYGVTVPCPGVFPAYINCSSKTIGLDTGVEITSVIAGPEHLLVRERHSRLLPFSGNRMRIVESAYANRILGGRYTEDYVTAAPVLKPYGGVRNILLNGIPESILQLKVNTTEAMIGGNAQLASDPLNYYEIYNTGFKYPNLISHFNEYGHFLATGTTNTQLLSCNFTNKPGELALNPTAGAINPAFNVSLTLTPVFTEVAGVLGSVIKNFTNANSCSTVGVPLGKDLPLTSISLGRHPTVNRLLPGFTQSTTCPEVYVLGNTAVGAITASTASIKCFATYATKTSLGNPLVTYLALNNQDKILGGVLTVANAYVPDLGDYFRFRITADNAVTPVIRPPLGYYRSLTSDTSQPGSAIQTKTLWVNTYPIDSERWLAYADIKTTQYGYVLLENVSRRLQYMFSAYHGDLIPAEHQVPSKLIHAPPRSVDWRSAWNMGLGVDPRTTADSLYKTNNNPNTLLLDSHLHGGGGHLIAVGTYNGIAVHDNTVAVWGSNRWGQCIPPVKLTEYLSTTGAGIVDVAAAVGPQVQAEGSSAAYVVPGLDEELMEYVARSYVDDPSFGTLGGTTVFSAGSYPYSVNPSTSTERYAAHVSYLNLPGHVGVVTANGRVYCWGNNQYSQCEVPAAINLVNAAGVIDQSTPTDPVVELATGGYHCVARTKLGAIYVWGAGNSAIASSANGYVMPAGSSPIPASDQTARVASRSVHFGQSVFKAGTNNMLAVPEDHPPGILNATSDLVYATGNEYSSVTDVTNHAGLTVGQVTNTGFGLSNPTNKVLKGTIAAGAFHTAIIDSKLKIQCVGAGRVYGNAGRLYRNYDPDSFFSDPSVVATELGPMWGTSYTEYQPSLPTYPHHCQSMDQYHLPAEPEVTSEATDRWQVQLARFRGGALAAQHRPFQDLTFKKVVCGPYTTHGIVHSMSRVRADLGGDAYTTIQKVSASGRVVSWGRASPTMLGYAGLTTVTGPTGLGYNVNASFNAADNPCMQIAGTGSRDQLVGMLDTTLGIPFEEGFGTTRAFSLLNRGFFTPTTPSNEVIGLVSVEDRDNYDSNFNPICCYPSGSPISVSKFKVKDVAPGSDFTGYIGYINNLQKSYYLSRPGQVPNADINGVAASTFDFEASVFFTGSDINWFPEIFNPYSGFRFIRRNRQTDEIGTNYLYAGNTALKVKTRSYYYGKIKDITGAAATLGTTPTSVPINYVVPSSLHVSSSGTVVVVNADNRPVAWKAIVPGIDGNGIGANTNSNPSLDLSLLPTLPFSGFKTGLGHIVAATTGDWPIAKSLNTLAGVPDIASALGSILSTTITGPTVPSSILHTTKKSHQPVLVAWGAGDGREYGTSLLSGGYNVGTSSGGLGGGPGVPNPWGGSALASAAYGMWFLDTHAITRYDNSVTGTPAGYATFTDAAPAEFYVGLSNLTGQSAPVNYYGDYRWLMHSDLANVEADVDAQPVPHSNPGLPLGSHLIEALQAKFSFNPATYPATVVTSLTGSPVLNGTAFAKIPQAYGMPWTNFDTGTAELKKCCTTAAEATTTNQRINHLQEYHGPLSLEIQNDYEYITDYDAGATTTAVLFNSSITDYNQVAIDGHLTNSANYVNYFDTPNAGFRFDRRRVNKLAITGYGCEGQTAGPERILKDGTLTPIVPRIFSKSAKVYCGASYTAVTDPIKIHRFSSTAGAQSLNFTASNTKTFNFVVPTTKFANRIRGLDVRLTFTASAANADTVPVNFNNWEVNIQYQQNNWLVAYLLQRTAGAATLIKGTNLHDSAVTTSTFVFSDRFNPNTAYTYIGTKETYTEAGLMPVPAGGLPVDAAAYSGNFLYPIPPAGTAITATNSRTGCYPACSTVGSVGFLNTWNYRDASAAAALLKFNQTPITVVITDGTTTPPNYINLTLDVELVVEVDDGPYPMVVYGRRKAGIWTGAGADGPSYQADYFAFTGVSTVASDLQLEKSCPCLLDTTLDDLNNATGIAGRQQPVSYPADSRFICGTRKYGPSGNPEIVANILNIQPTFEPIGNSAIKILGDLTANFKSVFSLVRNRPILNDIVTGTMLAPTLYSFPPAAFIINTAIIDLGAPTAPPIIPAKLATNSLPTYLGLKFEMLRLPGQPKGTLLTSTPNLNTKSLNVNSPACILKLITTAPNLGLKFPLTVCIPV